MQPVTKQYNICHLISGDLWAGAEVMASHLLQAISKSPSMMISAVVFNEGRLANELTKAGIDVTVFDESKYTFPLLVYKVFQLLRIKKIDIIHSHRRKENMLALLVAISLRKIKLVTTLHGMPEIFSRSINFNMLLNEFDFFILSQKFHCTVAVSNEIQNILIRNRKFKPQKTITIHNGIPVHSFLESETKNSQRYFTIGTAGRLVPIKDLPLFIAVASLLKENKNIHFMIAGDGPLSEELLKKVNELSLKNIAFVGHIDNMNSFYSQIDVFMNTSLHEGIPMTILEAMSLGKPVIAPQIGGIPEIIDNNVNGFLIPNREPKNFAEKCSYLFSNNLIYKQVASAAQQKIHDKFSILKMKNSYLNVYKELVN